MTKFQKNSTEKNSLDNGVELNKSDIIKYLCNIIISTDVNELDNMYSTFYL